MNIKKQTSSIRSYGTPSIFKNTIYWHIENGCWYYGDITSPKVEAIGSFAEDSTKYWSVNENDNYWYYGDTSSGLLASGSFAEASQLPSLLDNNDFQAQLNLLNARLNTIHKELSYWDLYTITHTVTSEESFPSVIAALAVGNSAVINTDTFTYAGNVYHRGDVIVKINDSEEILIPAINTGVYKPTTLEGTGSGSTYQLTFEYQEAATSGDIATISGITVSNSTTYGEVGDLTSTSSSYAFYIETYDGDNILPVIKIFYDNEEISLDCFDLATSGEEYIYTINDSDLFDSGRTFKIQVK